MVLNRSYGAIAGMLAVAVALGISELVAAFAGGVSLVVAVGDLAIASAPGRLTRIAIDSLGSYNKPALLVAVTGGALLAGLLLGALAARSRGIGFAALAALGVLGALAMARDPLTAPALATVNGAAAAIAGAGALALLLDRVPSTTARGSAAVELPGPGIGSRRRFLAFASGAAGAAVLSALPGRRLGETVAGVDARRQAITLPGLPTTTQGGDAGFDVVGLSPLVTPRDEFFRIDTALVVPRVDPTTWRLGVTGMVDRPYEVTFDELVERASLEESITLACVSNEVGGHLVGNAIWRGVPLAELLERAGVQRGATQVVGRSVEGFTVGFPTEVALDGRAAMVAIAMNGEPLPARHGFPARLVVPGLYGYVSATKWLREIELTTLEAYDAYWVPRGWAKEAPIKTQSRIDVPRYGQRLRAGVGAIAGVAWGGIGGIGKVEVRIRSGDADEAPWREARLSEPLSDSSWRQWVVEWHATLGDHQIEVRATDRAGEVQTAEVRPPFPDGATGYHRSRVQVREA